jgi:hypothetical protein
MLHCAIEADVDAAERNYPSPQLPREFFPLPFNKRGFEFGISTDDGPGALIVQLNHVGSVDQGWDDEPTLKFVPKSYKTGEE